MDMNDEIRHIQGFHRRIMRKLNIFGGNNDTLRWREKLDVEVKALKKLVLGIEENFQNKREHKYISQKIQKWCP